MIFNETIKPIQGQTAQYGIVVCNPDGSAVWSGGTWTPYTMKAYYNEDATYSYEYYCEANIWTSLTDFDWRVFRVRTTIADWKFFDKTWANWWLFNNQATDLTTVEALTYN